ncbi:MAG: hypothetical protein LBI87_05380 [Candidatus Accumulibacter sp.]|jgi:hypothetical protein|nr:hypothetical protein [Accumulibacter sp.]
MPELSPILQVAKDILSETRKEMHVNEITKLAMEKNKNLGLSEEDFVKKLNAAMAANLKTQKQIFFKPLNKQRKPRKGVYALKKSASAPIVHIVAQTPPATNTLFLGKAGEYAVASELLFWGFNVSLMAVDQGVDMVAEKNGKFHHIQVKTSGVSDGRPFGFTIQEKPFIDCQKFNPWYVFAMRQGTRLDYAVIPSSHLQHLRTTGIIQGKALSIQISRDNKGKQYNLNGTHDINMYINNFGLIQ